MLASGESGSANEGDGMTGLWRRSRARFAATRFSSAPRALIRAGMPSLPLFVRYDSLASAVGDARVAPTTGGVSRFAPAA